MPRRAPKISSVPDASAENQDQENAGQLKKPLRISKSDPTAKAILDMIATGFKPDKDC